MINQESYRSYKEGHREMTFFHLSLAGSEHRGCMKLMVIRFEFYRCHGKDKHAAELTIFIKSKRPQ
jgi:hypothetical protein